MCVCMSVSECVLSEIDSERERESEEGRRDETKGQEKPGEIVGEEAVNV